MAIKINGQDLLKRYINGQEILRVYKNGGQVRPSTTPPVFDDYLCFTANQSNSTISFSYVNNNSGNPTRPSHSFEVSYDKLWWDDYTMTGGSGTTITLSNVGDKIYFRNKSDTPVILGVLPYHYQFSMSGSIAASGDISSLLCKSGSTTIPGGYFRQMFSRCTALTSAPKLPFAALTDYCYERMFEACSNLVTPPQLPATTLATSCYNQMFIACTSLATAPALPATTVANTSYYQMFASCTALTSAPQLPATTLGTSCYFGMFSSCTNITQTPSLPATTLASSCYREMFSGTGVTTLPELPATTMADYCYVRMFRNCGNIKLSETQTGDYQTEFRIPSAGTGDESSATSPFVNMFAGTGGTFTGTPTINTTYYTSNTIIS